MSYDEPARSYITVVYMSLVLLTGFVIDAFLGGAVVHLPGWLLAAVLVLGVHALIVHAARSTRSLHLTGTELRVGDEAVDRSAIIGVTRGVDPGLSVLGWTTGLPRGVDGITVLLAGDERLVVPVRHPERLEAALGVGAPAVPKEKEAEIRPATEDDLPHLASIDERAEVVFRVAGYDLPEIEFPDDLDDAKAIFVAGTPPVGFVRVDEVDGLAHLEEIAVLPGSMRRGIGTRLMERAFEWARAERYPAVTLITYADVPWNGPYYVKLGFAETDNITPGLATRRERERTLGLDDVGPRIVMRRDL